MSRKPILGISMSLLVLLLLGGLYTNCQPIGDGLGANQSSGSSTDPGVIPEGPGTVLTKGQELWANTALPLFRNQCASCHALPFQGGTAPLTIFNYDLMKALAQSGPTSSDNPLMNKMKNIVAHGGDNQCPGDVNGSVSPCREIKDWVLAEFPLLTDGKAGVVTKTDLVGRVTGWVADPLNFANPVQAIFYIGGPVGIGVLAGNQLANLPGIGATNGKYYNIQLSEIYRDGVERDLYVYADTAVDDNLIPFMPVKTQAFQPKPLADPIRNLYEDGLRPRLNQCMGCHQVDYSVHWFQLGNPTPLEGGTATNNELIDYMNGQNNHSGGSFCGGNKNNEPCASVQRWWAGEFGS